MFTRHATGAKVNLDDVAALAEALDGDDLARIAAVRVTSTDEMSSLFRFWASESFAFAKNTSYAQPLLADLGGGTGTRVACSAARHGH